MKKLISFLLATILLFSVMSVCGMAAEERLPVQNIREFARKSSTCIPHAVSHRSAKRGANACEAIPAVDLDDASFLAGSVVELPIGLFNPGTNAQFFQAEIYRGSDINKITEKDYVTSWTGGLPYGISNQELSWDTQGQPAGNYIFLTAIYDTYLGSFLPDSFYYINFSLVKTPIALKWIYLRDAETEAVLKDTRTLSIGDTLTFYTVFSPANATASHIKSLTSSNPGVAQIEDYGGIYMVLAQLPGQTRITVTANGSVTYFDLVVPGKLTLQIDRPFLSMKQGEKVSLHASVGPYPMGDYANTKWSSDNPTVATVSNGWITANAPGTAIITCTSSYAGLSAAATCKISVPEEGDVCADYTDIDRSQWYHSGVDYAIENLLMGSTKTDTLTFEPNVKLTRAMVAAILCRIAGNPEVEYEGFFTDVNTGAWYTNAVEWCAQNGLASGKGNGKFDPNGNVTRQEIAVFMMKMAEYLDKNTSGQNDLSGFDDAERVPAWAEAYVRWAVDAGLISGKASGDKTYLAPTDNASRAEFASIIMRFIQNIAKAE